MQVSHLRDVWLYVSYLLLFDTKIEHCAIVKQEKQKKGDLNLSSPWLDGPAD